MEDLNPKSFDGVIIDHAPIMESLEQMDAPEAVTLVDRPVIAAPATTEQLIIAELATLNEYDVLMRTRQRVAELNAALAALS